MIPLRARIPGLLKLVQARESYLDMNRKLLDVFRGNLLQYVDAALKIQLQDGQSYKSARERIAPINVLRRMIDKQSSIYSSGVRRTITGGSKNESTIFSALEDAMKPSQRMQIANEYLNLFKSTLIQPYLSRRGVPSVRSIPSDRFVAYSTDRNEDETPTGFIIILGQEHQAGGRVVTNYFAIEDLEFVYFNSDGKNITELYAPNNPDGLNGYERIPFVYVNRDPASCMPVQDTDMLAMSVLIPVLFTDINFAHMYQAFSILYGIDVTDAGLTFSPNAFWSFKSKPGTDQKPQVGTIKPESDISGGLELVAAEFSFWLNTRGIKPGAVGEVNAANFASGISKIMDEMDTSEDRQKQVPFLADAESELWDLVLHTMLPDWQRRPGYAGVRGIFSPSAKITANFAEQVPLVRRGAVVAEQKAEQDAGYTTRKRAMKTINPTLTDDEIDQLMAAVDEEKAVSTTTALNGAQVTSLVEVLTSVGSGAIPPETAKAVIKSAYGLPDEIVNAMVDPIEVNEPEKKTPPAPPAPFGGAA
jgi:hypothetical protein